MKQVPVFCNVLFDSEAAARSVGRGDIRLVFCEACTFLFNDLFDESLLAYSPDYANSLSCSPSFGSFLQETAERLVSRYRITDSTVLELGCGDGDFLGRLCSIGNNRGLGFDPSYAGGQHLEAGRGVEFATRYYKPGDDVQADLACARHVLEHVARPAEFLGLLAGAARPGGRLYVEVPSANYMLENAAVWDLIYEHPGYFTDRALVRLAQEAGLSVTECGHSFQDQYLYIDCCAGDGDEGTLEKTATCNELSALADGFSGVFTRTIDRWNSELERLAAEGRKVVAWGAGSKGVTFLNLLASEQVEYIVDINPAKHGRFVPGSAQRVIGPDALIDYRPGIVLLMNGAYESEVKSMLRSLNVEAQVTVVS